MPENKGSVNEPAAPQLAVTRSPNFRDIYANGIRVRVSPIDFQITFSKNLDVPGVSAIQDEASISMPLSFAKIVSLHLSQAIEAAETVLGPIRVPVANLPQEEMFKNIIEHLQNAPLTADQKR